MQLPPCTFLSLSSALSHQTYYIMKAVFAFTLLAVSAVLAVPSNEVDWRNMPKELQTMVSARSMTTAGTFIFVNQFIPKLTGDFRELGCWLERSLREPGSVPHECKTAEFSTRFLNKCLTDCPDGSQAIGERCWTGLRSTIRQSVSATCVSCFFPLNFRFSGFYWA